jgi:hypothetical protein
MSFYRRIICNVFNRWERRRIGKAAGRLFGADDASLFHRSMPHSDRHD